MRAEAGAHFHHEAYNRLTPHPDEHSETVQSLRRCFPPLRLHSPSNQGNRGFRTVLPARHPPLKLCSLTSQSLFFESRLMTREVQIQAWQSLRLQFSLCNFQVAIPYAYHLLLPYFRRQASLPSKRHPRVCCLRRSCLRVLRQFAVRLIAPDPCRRGAA